MTTSCSCARHTSSIPIAVTQRVYSLLQDFNHHTHRRHLSFTLKPETGLIPSSNTWVDYVYFLQVAIFRHHPNFCASVSFDTDGTTFEVYKRQTL
jgi:hypothetical protein